MWIGLIGPIPIIDEDDPRFEAERAAWSAATEKAQALRSADELLEEVRDPDWRVRHESVPRLAARWKDDPRTLPSLLAIAADDETWQVRSAAVMKLLEFQPRDVEATLRVVLEDAHDDGRWTARYVLYQLEWIDDPPPGLT